MTKHHTQEDIQIVLEFMSIYPHFGSNREAKEIILQLQNEIESLTREADNRVQCMADQLEKAQIALGDKLLEVAIDSINPKQKTLTEQNIIKAKKAILEYNEAYGYGEEPHFPQWAEDYLNSHSGDKNENS